MRRQCRVGTTYYGGYFTRLRVDPTEREVCPVSRLTVFGNANGQCQLRGHMCSWALWVTASPKRGTIVYLSFPKCTKQISAHTPHHCRSRRPPQLTQRAEAHPSHLASDQPCIRQVTQLEPARRMLAIDRACSCKDMVDTCEHASRVKFVVAMPVRAQAVVVRQE